MKYEDLYEGLPKEQAEAWRKEAREKWPEQVAHAEEMLLKMDKSGFKTLQDDFKANFEKLASMSNLDPESREVQQEIERHYNYILKFWGKTDNQAEAYKGLGNLYADDERYSNVNGLSNPAFGRFLEKAITYFAETQLK